jgi:hypothetical protein
MVAPLVAAAGVAYETAPIWIPIVLSFVAVIGAAGIQLVSGRKEVNWDEAWDVGTIVAISSPISGFEAGAVRGAEGLAAKASTRALAAGEKELPKAAETLGPKLVAAARRELARFPDIAKDIEITYDRINPESPRNLGLTFFNKLYNEPIMVGDKATGITFFTDAVKAASKDLGKIVQKITPVHEATHVATTNSESFWKGAFDMPPQVRNFLFNKPTLIGGKSVTADELLVDTHVSTRLPGSASTIQQMRGLSGTKPNEITNQLIDVLKTQAKVTGDKAYSTSAKGLETLKNTFNSKGIGLSSVLVGFGANSAPQNNCTCSAPIKSTPTKPAPSPAKSAPTPSKSCGKK